MTSVVTRSDVFSGNETEKRVPVGKGSIASVTDCTVAGRSSRPQREQEVRPMRAQRRRR
jgi:hypothetical protein